MAKACCRSQEYRGCHRCLLIMKVHLPLCSRPMRWYGYRDGDGTKVYICSNCTKVRRGAARRRPTISAATRRRVIARDGLACHWCGVAVVQMKRGEPYRPDHLHLDHVVPYATVRKHEVTNLVVSCAACNLGRQRSRA